MCYYGMDDVESMRAEVIAGLNDVKATMPNGPGDQIVPDDVQESMKSKLHEILDSAE